MGNGEGRSGNFHFYAIFTLLTKSMRKEGRNNPSFDNFHVHTNKFFLARLAVVGAVGHSKSEDFFKKLPKNPQK